jgi:hypothetical protein
VTSKFVSAVLLVASAVYFLDLFLRWSSGEGHGSFVVIGQVVGWDVSVAAISGPVALALALVEVAAMTAVWRSGAQRLVSFFLAAGTGVLAVAAVLNLRWGGSYDVLRFGRFAAGAWIALALGIVLLACAALRLVELRASRAG